MASYQITHYDQIRSPQFHITESDQDLTRWSQNLVWTYLVLIRAYMMREDLIGSVVIHSHSVMTVLIQHSDVHTLLHWNKNEECLVTKRKKRLMKMVTCLMSNTKSCLNLCSLFMFAKILYLSRASNHADDPYKSDRHCPWYAINTDQWRI